MKTMMNESPNEISTTNSRGNRQMKKFTKIFKNEKGLTLIELLAVIVILAIVAAIATPAIGNIIQNSRDKSVLADASSIISGAKLAVIDNACGEATGGVTTCTNVKLQPYVEGITLASSDKVTKTVTTGSTVWEVTYSKLADVKGDAYKNGIDGATTTSNINDVELSTNLKK